jgi:hypothetical protein
MERSEIRDTLSAEMLSPHCASLHAGYGITGNSRYDGLSPPAYTVFIPVL